MLQNKKIAVGLLVASIIAPAGMHLVGAETSPSSSLTATCSGVVSSSVITWTATVSSGTEPYSYAWSGTGVSGTSSAVGATYSANGTYSATVLVGDTTTSTVTTSCSATVTSFPPPPPPPPPAPTSTVIHRVLFFREPMLQINPGGHFLARGMVVQSVASGSFTGKVWGTTWTVNVPSFSEFILRDGKGVKVSATDQLQVGDEVGVSGKIDPNHELTVIADVVRNYSILVVRPKVSHEERKEAKKEIKELRGEIKDERREMKGEGSGNQDIRNQIEQLMAEIRKIQEQLKNR